MQACSTHENLGVCRECFLVGLPDDLTEQMETRCVTRVVGAAIGNALSLNVVERVLRNLLWASSLVSELPSDFWQCLGPLPATGVTGLHLAVVNDIDLLHF